jgi:hypothetical protein
MVVELLFALENHCLLDSKASWKGSASLLLPEEPTHQVMVFLTLEARLYSKQFLLSPQVYWSD